MKNAMAYMLDTIEHITEGFTLKDGKLVPLNESVVAKANDSYHRYFMEMARDAYSTQAVGMDGIDQIGAENEMQMDMADPAMMTADHMPTEVDADMDPAMAGGPDMGMQPPMGQPPMGAPGAMPPAAPGGAPMMGESIDQIFEEEIGEPDWNEILGIKKGTVREFQQFGDDQMGGDPSMDAGMGDGMDAGMDPMAGGDDMGGDPAMGDDMGEPGLDDGMDSMGPGMDPGMGDDMAAAGGPGDATMSLQGPGFDFNFDLDDLGFGDGADVGAMGDDAMVGDNLDAEGPGAGPNEPMDGGDDMGGDPAMGDDMGEPTGDDPMKVQEAKNGGKMNVVPSGKPKTTKARPGLPAKK